LFSKRPYFGCRRARQTGDPDCRKPDGGHGHHHLTERSIGRAARREEGQDEKERNLGQDDGEEPLHLKLDQVGREERIQEAPFQIPGQGAARQRPRAPNEEHIAQHATPRRVGARRQRGRRQQKDID
ncbi:MAG: hypothetical protein ACK55I_50555, partial [bacterium]